jgi:tetratricopeptide (TPR) repeat protein
MFAAERHPRTPIYLTLTHLLGGIAAIASGNVPEARSRLDRQKGLYQIDFDTEASWATALEAEIALASGDGQKAAQLLSRGQPRRKLFGFDPIGFAVFVNHLPSRDGAARAAKAGGDLQGAIAAYRKLLSPSADSKWISVLEPRYVLELARLLELTGDRRGALAEYQRFLELWKRADPDLPELDEARRAVRRLQPSRTN